MTRFFARYCVLLGVVFFFLIDQISKWWALHACSVYTPVTQWLSFCVVLNRGLSWGIATFDNDYAQKAVLILVCVIFLIALYHLYIRWTDGKLLFPLICIGTGAMSNVVDRLLYGGVIDFIVLHYQDWIFPTFNVADALICVGVSIMLVEEYFL